MSTSLGRTLAVRLLEELSRYRDGYCHGYDCSVDAENRAPGTTHYNAVLRYLDASMADGGRDAIVGFCEFLSDYVGAACASGGADTDPDSDYYGAFIECGPQ